MASILAIIIRECINTWIIMLFTNLQQIKFLKHYIVQSVLLFSKFLEFLSAIFWVMHWTHILQEDKGLAMVPFDPLTGFRWQIENGSPSITALSLWFSLNLGRQFRQKILIKFLESAIISTDSTVFDRHRQKQRWFKIPHGTIPKNQGSHIATLNGNFNGILIK